MRLAVKSPWCTAHFPGSTPAMCLASPMMQLMLGRLKQDLSTCEGLKQNHTSLRHFLCKISVDDLVI